MGRQDRIMRGAAFYFSVALYFLLLPIVLSYSLGYKIDYKRPYIYKTGIIFLKSQPSGASIYLNGRPISDITPARIEELRPGRYNVKVKREGFYPWQKDLVVRPNMVTKAEEIVLFPLHKDVKRISRHEVLDFVISENAIYYMTALGLFRVDSAGTNLVMLASYSNWPRDIKGKVFSPDKEKLLLYNKEGIWVIYLKMMEERTAQKGESAKVIEVLKSQAPISDAFWYSQSNYIVFVTSDGIDSVELSGEGTRRNTASLYKFPSFDANGWPRAIYYNEKDDSLYFIDIGKGPGLKEGSYLYRLDLRQKFFDQLMQRIKKEFDTKYEER